MNNTLKAARGEVALTGRVSSTTAATLEAFGYNVPALERRLREALRG